MEGTMELAVLKYQRNLGELAPIEYKGKLFDFDETSQSRLLGALIALDGSVDSIEWTCADDSTLEIGADDIKEIFMSAFLRSNELHQKYRALRDKVNQGEEVEW